MTMPHSTSLSTLDDSKWHQISNRWARGVDWYVTKVGRHWQVMPELGGFPLFKTKREASEAATNLILAESRYRAAKRDGLPTYG